MDYTLLTPDQQAQMVTARLRRYEQQHYDTQLNLDLLPGTNDGTPQTIETLTAKLADLAKTIEKTRAILAKLPAVPVPVRPGPARP